MTVIKLKYESRDKHVHTRIFTGQHKDHLTLCGNLIFTREEFDVFSRCLRDGSMLVKGAEVILSDSTGGSSSVNPRIKLPPEEKK